MKISAASRQETYEGGLCGERPVWTLGRIWYNLYGHKLEAVDSGDRGKRWLHHDSDDCNKHE